MITWNTDVNAPCCPGEIIGPRYRDDQTGRWTNDRILIQTDWDFPATAETFGWSTRNVQVCPECTCDHNGTDGTVDCKCGITVGQFIDAAREWHDNNDGATAEDPGYFA